MSDFQLAQVNVARLKAPLDSPTMAEFVAALDPINELADRAPGFVWRLQTPEGDATSLRPLGDDLLVNLSVWESVAELANYAYRSGHVEVMRRRREWFERLAQLSFALWWIPRGHVPTIEEAIERLDHLRRHGPSAVAFNFRQPFGPPDAVVSSEIGAGGAADECPAP